MRVAITGGTGLVGAAVGRLAIIDGHEVRALARHAPDRNQLDDPLMQRVQYVEGDVTDAESLASAFADVDAVVHAAGIAREEPPNTTFRTINIEGTRNVVSACERAGTPRLVFISSLGADRGHSQYHASKRFAERLVREYEGEWIILRPGNIYAADGGQIALFLELIRILPVVPIVGSANRHFQPVAATDFAQAVIQSCLRPHVVGRTFDVAGAEITSQRDLYNRITRLVDRKPPLLPIPSAVAILGAELLGAINVSLPVWKDQLEMIDDGNTVLNRNSNALRDVFGVEPMTLDEGLHGIAHDTPEQFPELGTGRIVRRRFSIEIENSPMSPEAVIQLLRSDFPALMPQSMIDVGTEPVSEEELQAGATISLALPVRGHVLVRVEEVTKYSVTCVTLDGHPLSGVVRFLAERRGRVLRFEVQTIDRPRNVLDRVVMSVLGTHLKRITWFALLRNVTERVGGTPVGDCCIEEEPLSDAQGKRVQEWIHELVARRMKNAVASMHISS